MRLSVELFAVTACLFAQWIPSLEDRVVFVKGGQVFSATLDGQGLQQITSGGAFKRSPRLSPDGKLIAFAQKSQNPGTLAEIGIVSVAGEPIKVIPFRPPTPIPVGGMRFIEEIEWVGPDRLAVSGSVNPENCEYVVVDLTSREEVEHNPGACTSFVRSPDGQHLASFLPPGIGVAEDQRSRGLQIDNRIVYRPDKRNIRFIDPPAWSPNSKQIAVIERSVDSGARRVVVAWRLENAVALTLSGDTADAERVRWLDGSLYVGGHNAAYRVDLQARQLVIAGLDAQQAFTAAEAADQKRAEIAKKTEAVIRRLGGRAPDLSRFTRVVH